MEEHKHEHNENCEHNHQNEELIMRASILQKHVEEINSNLEQIEMHVAELSALNSNLDSLTNENKDLISSIGNGVYAKTSLSGGNLLVSVGSNVLVEKTPQETKEMITSQIKQLNEARLQLKAQLEMYSHLLRESLMEIEKLSTNKST